MDISISLPQELIDVIQAKMESGRFTSASDVVEAALRKWDWADEAEAMAVAALRREWDEGIASGDAGPLDLEALKAEGRARLARLRAG